MLGIPILLFKEGRLQQRSRQGAGPENLEEMIGGPCEGLPLKAGRLGSQAHRKTHQRTQIVPKPQPMHPKPLILVSTASLCRLPCIASVRIPPPTPLHLATQPRPSKPRPPPPPASCHVGTLISRIGLCTILYVSMSIFMFGP